MDTDQFQEWQRISANYREKTDFELEQLANDAYDLTEPARQALAEEISTRGLRIVLREAEPPQPEHSREPIKPGDPANLDAELNLTTLCTVWTRDEAEKLDRHLEWAGIAHFFGQENVVEADDITSPFDRGVAVKVREDDVQRGGALLRHMQQHDDPNDIPKPDEEDGELVVVCPKCKTADPVLMGVDEQPDHSIVDSVYNWQCEACGHTWSDSGMETEIPPRSSE